MKYGTQEDFQFKTDLEPPPESTPLVPLGTPARRRGPRWARWSLAAAVAFIAGAATVQTVDWVAAQWQRSAALGGLFTALLAVALGAALLGAAREWRAWRELRDVEAARAALLSGEDARGIIDRLADAVAHRPDAAANVARFRAQAASLAERAELLELFAAEVLRPLDRAAYLSIARAARDAAVLNAVAPTAILDTAVLLWRNLRMIREIASTYGHRAGVAGTWFLLKRIASGAVVVAAADVAGTVALDHIGKALTSFLTVKIGEGAIAANRTARIGLWTMQLCRAVPFAEDDVPTLRRLAQSLVARPGML